MSMRRGRDVDSPAVRLLDHRPLGRCCRRPVLSLGVRLGEGPVDGVVRVGLPHEDGGPDGEGEAEPEEDAGGDRARVLSVDWSRRGGRKESDEGRTMGKKWKGWMEGRTEGRAGVQASKTSLLIRRHARHPSSMRCDDDLSVAILGSAFAPRRDRRVKACGQEKKEEEKQKAKEERNARSEKGRQRRCRRSRRWQSTSTPA